MLGTRHEEYTHFEAGVPCRIFRDIRITPKTHRSSANWHTNLELKLCTAGQGVVLLDGEALPFTEGDVIVCNSGVLHYTDSDSELYYTAFIVDTDFCRQLRIDPRRLQFCSRIRTGPTADLLRALARAEKNADDPLRVARCCRLLIELLLQLRENYTVSAEEHPLPDGDHALAERAIGYLREHYAERVSLASLAKALFVDKYALSRAFTQTTGCSLVRFLNDFRCQKAAELIQEGHTVAEAATACGFSNMSFFTKTFRARIGCLPSALKPPK